MIVDMTVSSVERRLDEKQAEKTVPACWKWISSLNKEGATEKFSRLKNLHKDAQIAIRDSFSDFTISGLTTTSSNNQIVFHGPIEFKSSVSFGDAVTFPSGENIKLIDHSDGL